MRTVTEDKIVKALALFGLATLLFLLVSGTNAISPVLTLDSLGRTMFFGTILLWIVYAVEVFFGLLILWMTLLTFLPRKVGKRGNAINRTGHTFGIN